MAGYFVLFKTSNNRYMFNLKAGNHETILTSSETYVTKQGAEKGINSVKANAPLDARYDRFKDSAGEYRFRLNASNGQVIGKSEGYKTEQSRDNGIESVKKNAPDAPTVDRT